MTVEQLLDEAPGKRSDRTKAAILRAARERLAAHGYDRTTIRAVAADAGIDPSMVMRYFGNKAQLFDAALDIDLRLPDLTGVPVDRAAAHVRSALPRPLGERPGDDALLVLLRSAVTNEHAASADAADLRRAGRACAGRAPWARTSPRRGPVWSPPNCSVSA